MDRERLLDMEERLVPVRRITMLVLALALVLCAPWIGWWTLLPLAIAAGFFALADAKLGKAERPEYLMFGAWVGSEIVIAAAVALSGGPLEATLSWLAIPIVTLSARFSLRGVVVGVVIAIVLMLAVAFGVRTDAVLDNPPLIIAPLALIVATAALSTALMRSDLEHRSEAVIDPLTGMLNRKALANRVDELAQQSQVTGEPIGVIVADVDNFKQVNDLSGHAAGDAVLTDLAYAMRKHLRAFDLAYRVGGEEFLILLPGADAPEAATMAEDLRSVIENSSLGDGESITMSLGVSASPARGEFKYHQVFAVADKALYEAKAMGRNRVCVSGDAQERPEAEARKDRARSASTATA